MRPSLSLAWTSLIKLGWMDSKLLGFVCLCFLSPRKPVCLIWVLGLNSGPYTFRASALLTEPSHQSVPKIHQHCQEHLSMLYNGAIFIMSILTSVLLSPEPENGKRLPESTDIAVTVFRFMTAPAAVTRNQKVPETHKKRHRHRERQAAKAPEGRWPFASLAERCFQVSY